MALVVVGGFVPAPGRTLLWHAYGSIRRIIELERQLAEVTRERDELARRLAALCQAARS